MSGNPLPTPFLSSPTPLFCPSVSRSRSVSAGVTGSGRSGRRCSPGLPARPSGRCGRRSSTRGWPRRWSTATRAASRTTSTPGFPAPSTRTPTPISSRAPFSAASLPTSTLRTSRSPSPPAPSTWRGCRATRSVPFCMDFVCCVCGGGGCALRCGGRMVRRKMTQSCVVLRAWNRRWELASASPPPCCRLYPRPETLYIAPVDAPR